jgi:hypothetical protein
LTQLAKYEESIGKKTRPHLEFECITKMWHRRLGANARSIMLVLEVKFAINDEPKILYESTYQRDEIIVLVWYIELGLGHY